MGGIGYPGVGWGRGYQRGRIDSADERVLVIYGFGHLGWSAPP
jgi:hypothetical protein